MLVEELDRNFFSPLVDLTSSPISKHLVVMHEHRSETFPTDPIAYAQLQKSLLKVAKSAYASIVAKVKEIYQQLAVKLETLAFQLEGV